MTNQDLKNRWITIRADTYNKSCLDFLSRYYDKSKSDVIRGLLHQEYKRVLITIDEEPTPCHLSHQND
jgi:hypothetical protein